MTDPAGRFVSALAPGAVSLASGRFLSGATALTLWVSLLTLAVVRWDRIPPFLMSGSPDERLSVVALVAILAGIWWWSIRGRGEPEGAVSTRRRWRFRGLRRNRMAVVGIWAAGGVGLIALLAPLVAPYDPTLQGDLIQGRLEPPSTAHLLGTDQFARDVFSRLVYGARVSLGIGLVAVAISISIGVLLGTVAGFYGGWVDGAVMRLVDVVIAFPRLVLLIAVIALFQPSIEIIVLVLGLTQWPASARIVRGEVLGLREREFVLAGRGLGYSDLRLMLRHILPNALPPAIVAATLGIGDTVILEAGLSFLGLGVQPPTPSWGGMVADGRNHLLGAWWLATFPGLAIVLVVLSFNLAGDGFRDALDPRLRGGG